MRHGLYLVICCFLLLPLQLSGQTEIPVRPSATDIRIEAHDDFHFAFINENVSKKGLLFVFFPGTGALPQHYREIGKAAANLGYHSIGLTYPNALAAKTACGGLPDTLCHEYMRKEIITGEDLSDKVHVDRVNCIENRLEKLLLYLTENYPDAGWEHFLVPGDAVNWSRVVTSGHSQGAGHAGMISKMYPIARCVMFAGMDITLGKPAAWISRPGATPPEKLYGFTHLRDPFFWGTGQLQLQVWQAYGMDTFGDVVNVDNMQSPYDGSHMLVTNERPENDTTNFHGAVVASYYTPMSLDGVPLFLPVWEYMLGTETVSSFGAGAEPVPVRAELFTNYPNPFTITTTLTFNLPEPAFVTLDIYNAVGQHVATITHKEYHHSRYSVQFDATNLNAGIYFARLTTGTAVHTQKLILHR